MIGSGSLPTLIFKCRNKWCFSGTVFVHNMVCRYNRNLTSYFILGALGQHYRPDENTLFFFFFINCETKGPDNLDLFFFHSTYHMFFALCNNNGYYLLSNHNVPEHYKHICLCVRPYIYIYTYLHLFTYINTYKAMNMCMWKHCENYGKHISY